MDAGGARFDIALIDVGELGARQGLSVPGIFLIPAAHRLHDDAARTSILVGKLLCVLKALASLLNLFGKIRHRIAVCFERGSGVRGNERVGIPVGNLGGQNGVFRLDADFDHPVALWRFDHHGFGDHADCYLALGFFPFRIGHARRTTRFDVRAKQVVSFTKLEVIDHDLGQFAAFDPLDQSREIIVDQVGGNALFGLPFDNVYAIGLYADLCRRLIHRRHQQGCDQADDSSSKKHACDQPPLPEQKPAYGGNTERHDSRRLRRQLTVRHIGVKPVALGRRTRIIHYRLVGHNLNSGQRPQKFRRRGGP